MSTDRKPSGTKEKLLSTAGRMLSPLVYGLAVTMLLALYFSVKAGDISQLARMLKFVGLTFTPWFMSAYSVSRQFLPDINLFQRSTSLLLPALEGLLATVFMALLMIWGEANDPFVNFALDAGRLLGSVIAARLVIRRTFQY